MTANSSDREEQTRDGGDDNDDDSTNPHSPHTRHFPGRPLEDSPGREIP